jgi:hypothetical protein
VTGVEGLGGVLLGVAVGGEFFEEEEGARGAEGVRRGLAGDDGLQIAILRVEAPEQVQHLAGLGDRLTNITKAVSEFLEFGGVVRHGKIALLQGAELRLEENGALELVVAEEGLDVGPDGVGGGARLVDDVKTALEMVV